MRNKKKSDKNWCAEKEHNEEDRRDNGGCAEEADVNEEQEKSDKNWCAEKEYNDKERRDNGGCAEEADDDGDDDDDKEERFYKSCSEKA